MSENEYKKLEELIKWLEDKLASKNLLSHSFGICLSVEDKKDGGYYVGLCLDDYRTSYIRFRDFGVRRKKFLETLVGEELEYFEEKGIATMNVRLDEKHIKRLSMLRSIYH